MQHKITCYLPSRTLIPTAWDYFLIDQLHIGPDTYRIQFDRYGTRYHGKCGLTVYKNSVPTEDRFISRCTLDC
ncbi:MAG: hypothetical protein SOT28_08015 [Fusicatenibacter sp.]|nr:hypothetical protein [Fusicatenibacter sp.]